MSDPPLEVSCVEVKSRLDASDDLLLVDCREQHEFDLVAIDGATLLPMGETPARVSELEEHRGHSILVYCHHGMRSAQVAVWLRGQGFTQAQSMAGGIDRWAVEIEPGMPRY